MQLISEDIQSPYAFWEKVLFESDDSETYVYALHWDGTHRDRVADQDNYPDLCPPMFHTDASAQYSACHPVVFAQHLDTSPNVG